MDEPTNHLDIASKNVLKQALKNFKGTLISIFITHNLNHIYPIADHLCVMARGEKIADILIKSSKKLKDLLVNG